MQYAIFTHFPLIPSWESPNPMHYDDLCTITICIMKISTVVGVTCNSASREDSDYKVRVEGRSWANKLHCLGVSLFNIQNECGKIHWPVSGFEETLAAPNI